MHACEREKGFGGQEAKKTRAKGQDQRGCGSRKATASGVLGLGLSPVWCVCVASVVCVSGRRGEQWQAPLWQCG